jgi:hypothetical protein
MPLPMTFILVIAFAAASLVRPGYLIAIGGTAFAGYAAALNRANADFTNSGLRFEIAIFGISTLFAVATAFGVNRVFNTACGGCLSLSQKANILRDSESSSMSCTRYQRLSVWGEPWPKSCPSY